jgi:outer membrane protein assembly factor BamB
MICAQSTEYFVTVSPSSGIHTVVDSIPGVKMVQIGPSCSTVDKLHGKYFFKGQDQSGNWDLYAMNGPTGKVIRKFPLPSNMGGFSNLFGLEYDDLSGNIFGLAWKASENKEYMVKLDTLTGVLGTVAIIPGLNSLIIGSNTFDQFNHHYFSIGSDTSNVYHLYRINTLNGQVVSSPTLSSSAMIHNPRYNSATSSLYGLVNSSSGIQLNKINPSTSLSMGTVATLTAMTSIISMPNYATIDELNNRFTLRVPSTPGNLYSVNLFTGGITFSPVFPVGLAQGENVIELRYNNANGILYGLHWGQVKNVTTGLLSGQMKGVITLAPNPFSCAARLVFAREETGASIRIFDAAGRLLSEQALPPCRDYVVENKNYDPGIYYLSVKFMSNEQQTIKMIIER